MTTNYATARYQEIYDINTVSNEVSIIAIHSPVGSKPRIMLEGFFKQFRKYKYKGCSVVGTPAQRLGLQMTDITVEAGSSGVNPKDVFNPALVRGCHGDNLNAALNSIYRGAFGQGGSSMDKSDYSASVHPVDGITWEQMYYRMLQDPSFKKFNLSSGIKMSGLHPMIYNVASNHQIMPNENYPNVGKLTPGTGNDGEIGFDNSTYAAVPTGNEYPSTAGNYPQLMTNRLQSLGWLDTRQLINSTGSSNGAPAFTVLPKIFMAVIVLPPALSASVVTSMRFVITHYFEFKEFNTSLTLEGASEYYDWLTAVSKESKANDTFDTNGVSDSIEAVSDGCF